MEHCSRGLRAILRRYATFIAADRDGTPITKLDDEVIAKRVTTAPCDSDGRHGDGQCSTEADAERWRPAYIGRSKLISH